MIPARARRAAGLVLAASALGACGGGDPARETSTADFCAAYNTFFTAFAGADPADTTQAIAKLKHWARGMRDVGTPGAMPADARRGLELIITTAESLDEDPSRAELDDLGAGFTPAQEKDGAAFNAWATQECPAPQVPASGLATP